MSFDPSRIRNIAIIAHVDHGKTTLVDGMLRQAGLFHEKQQVAERVLDSNDLERERGITIFSKNASIRWESLKINIVDTPGHADFGGEVERALRMVDGVILLVDAAEGPMPQTRFVLGKSLELGLQPIVVINKTDRPDARIAEVEDEILDLFIALGATEEQIEYPTLYGSGRGGYLGRTPDTASGDLTPLFETIAASVPAPDCDPAGPFQMLVSNLEYSDYVGQQIIGRIERGVLRKGQTIRLLRDGGDGVNAKITRLEVFDGLGRSEVPEAGAGDIIVAAGIEAADIGDTLSDPEHPDVLPALRVEPPTIAVEFRINDSPFAGQDGDYVTSRQLRERLFREALYDRALIVSETEQADTFRVAGRGELHIAVLIEKMRREGYEFSVSRPEVLIRDGEQGREEPFEELICDVPETASGNIIERLGRRKGVLQDMKHNGERVRLTFQIPTRGIIGFRTEFLSATRGEGLMSHRLTGFGPWQGAIEGRNRGALIAMDRCETVPYALFQLQDRGEFFVPPGTPVYGGMIVGEYNKPGDLIVNVGKTKKLTNVRASGSDDNVLLSPPRKMDLEQYLEFINDDELIEVTPKALRARKRILDHEQRKQYNRRRVA